MIGKQYIFLDVDIPEENPKDGAVYVCSNAARADLRCPCGCGDKIAIPILNDCESHPNWKINGTSITPSINRTVGCKSHFSITNGITH